MRTSWVYDYETIVNCFIAVFRELKNPSNRKVFIINPWRNDYLQLYDFLINCVKEKDSLYSYNGLKFDNQLSRFIIDEKTFKTYKDSKEGPYVELYHLAQQTITAGNFKSGIQLKYSSWDNPFVERDIMQINNYDNPNKRTSLKWLQYGMDWHNIEDMPIPHDKPIKESEVPKGVMYCDNDVLSLRKKVILDREEIILRQELTEFFNENLLSASEPQIAKKIFGLALSKAMNISEKDLKKLGTERDKIFLDEVILDYIKFNDPILQKTLRDFKKLTLDANNLNGTFKKDIRWKGLDITYGLGGIHGAKRGIHRSDKDFIIMSFDVVSFYPNLAIRNGWHPAHLPKDVFVNTYENQFHERRKYAKGTALNYVYKIVLNAAYGLSNEKHGSFLKDPLFTMKITCNGQLSLTMLMEELVQEIPCSRPLMLNTDGGEILMPRKYVDKFYAICKKWEELTKLELEYEKYNKLIIADVNTYLGVYDGVEISLEDAKAKIEKAKSSNTVMPLIRKTKTNKLLYYKVKDKGRYEIEKPLHKNKSFKIITLMVYNNLIHNIPIHQTLENNKNIMDFCGVIRAKGDAKLYYDCYDIDLNKMVLRPLQKTNRYFVSKSGCKIIKVTEKTTQKVEAFKGYETLLNVWDPKVPFEDYPIDKRYYLERATNELKKFVDLEIKNLNLFS